jgi:hypothetical protein
MHRCLRGYTGLQEAARERAQSALNHRQLRAKLARVFVARALLNEWLTHGPPIHGQDVWTKTSRAT